MKHIVKITNIEQLTPDVYQLKTNKPDGYEFTPGQATEVAINKEEWKEEARPFTFTSLNEDDYLEFTIKSYPDHNGVTNQIPKLKVGDELIVHDVWGAIEYKNKGVFIAGGAGVTPFISIFKMLEKENKLAGNKLIFSNKTQDDIILEDWWSTLLGAEFTPTLTHAQANVDYMQKRIDKAFLKEQIQDFEQDFYICGPDKMVKDISQALEELGATTNNITFEE